MDNFELNQKTRIIIAITYLLILIALLSIITTNFKDFLFNSTSDSKIIFFTGAFLLILGNYLVEPYFTKPSDSIVNSLAVIIALLGVNNKSLLYAYHFLLYYAIFILFASILTILLKDSKIGKALYYIIELAGKSKVIFSLVYLSSVYSYYGNKENLVEFVMLIGFWFLMLYVKIIEKIVQRVKIIKSLFGKGDSGIEGQLIGCDNPNLYTFEVVNPKLDFKYGDIVSLKIRNDFYAIGIVIHSKDMLSKSWIETYLLEDHNGFIELKNNNKNLKNNSIFQNSQVVRKLDFTSLETDIQQRIINSNLYKNINNFIGYVSTGSDINTINFTILRDEFKLSEGIIVETCIHNNATLFQVINGVTHRENLELHDKHGYLIGIARKLGIYNTQNNELEASKWVPNMYEPVFAMVHDIENDTELDEISKSSIGRLPNSKYKIPIKDINSIVTHNTAILGILGIGKSCLAFELISKVIFKDIKVIIIDITNQYGNIDTGLPTYVDKDLIKYSINEVNKSSLRESKNNKGNSSTFSEWGNESIYKKILDDEIKAFFEDEINPKKVFILNPDWHPVTKAASKFSITECVDLTVAEKTRIISERLFIYLMSKGETTDARAWLVYEEAHSLVPEWNSVANEGDKTATNGTSKVILQGRKYGLGCLLITQRTANISKSILNQCNTIFALRVFDDTGKSFLENYIGKDYSETLPTLEERHAIAIGKGLRLKQPVILNLNDKKYFDINKDK